MAASIYTLNIYILIYIINMHSIMYGQMHVSMYMCIHPYKHIISFFLVCPVDCFQFQKEGCLTFGRYNVQSACIVQCLEDTLWKIYLSPMVYWDCVSKMIATSVFCIFIVSVYCETSNCPLKMSIYENLRICCPAWHKLL